jgi:amino acid transporter
MSSPQKPVSSFIPRLGAFDVIAVSVAGVAPTLSMSLNPQQPEMHVGRAVPLTFALSTIVVLLVGWCFALLARSHPNAGSAYGYAASALGPRWGLVTGWALLGTYIAFSVVGVTGCGLFGSNLADRLHEPWIPSGFTLTLAAIVATGFLSLFPARSTAVILILVEGTSILVMTLLAAAILWKVGHGQGPAEHVRFRDLFVPPPWVGFSQIALAMSFGILSFGGFEQAATLGEEVKKSRSVIPKVLMATVLSVGSLYVLLTSSEIAGFGSSRADISRFLSSTSLLADLSSGFFGPWVGDLLDVLAFVSAFGCALAPILAASRILFALFRDVRPDSMVGSVSLISGTPRHATAILIGIMGLLFLSVSLGCHASVQDVFFWAATFSALTLLFVYLVVVLAASRSLARSHLRGRKLRQVIPALAAVAMAYTLWTCLVTPAKGAYRIIPWLALAWVVLPAIAAVLMPSLAGRVLGGLLQARDSVPESHEAPVREG